MSAARISLDGSWDFKYLGYGAKPAESRTILVPSPWQAQFADLRMRGGVAVYRRDVEIPEEWLEQRVFLHFGAVFHISPMCLLTAHSSAAMWAASCRFISTSRTGSSTERPRSR